MAGGLAADPYQLGLWPPMQIPGAFTFLTLPAIANLPVGCQCFTSDAGLCVWNGSVWTSSAAPGSFAPGGTTAAAINAAYVAANAAGGGTLYLGNKRYPLEITIVPKSGVKLKGVAPQLVYNTIPDSGLTALAGSAGGTVLAPTGAFDAIAWNTTVLGTPASQTAFAQGALTNIAFEDLGFDGSAGGIWAIHAGATNNPSCWYSQFTRLFATAYTNPAGGGFSITNYQHCQFNANYTFGCQWGQFHGIDVASATLAPGNSTYYDLYNVTPTSSATNMHTRGISFITTAALAAAADNNQFKLDRIQSNRFGQATTTQAATMTNAQATFTVTDGTKFDVGMPVSFSATANGFTLGVIYFVASVASNTLSVATTYGGTAVNATGSTAVNIINMGFPAFEMIALSGSAMTNCVIDNLDVEGGGTCAALFQNCTGFEVHLSQVPTVSQSTASVCGRSFVNSSLFSPQSCNTDMDGNSNGRAYQFFGARSANASTGYMGAGMWYDSVSGNSVLSLGSQFDDSAGGILTLIPSQANLVVPRKLGIGQFTVNSGTATPTLTTMCQVYNNTVSGTTITLPTLTASNLGLWLSICNTTATPQTLATNGTQTFNGVAGRTTLTINTNASVRVCAQNGTGGAFIWAIEGASSSIAAGVVSAPT